MSGRFLYVYRVPDDMSSDGLPVIVAGSEPMGETVARFRTTDDAEAFAYAVQLADALAGDTCMVHILPSADDAR